VYVGGGDGYLYALDASTGTTNWRSFVVDPGQTENAGYLWSSPTVIGGKIFIGIASNCDKPLIRGGVAAFDQHTGTAAGNYWTVPDGDIGGSVWSSVAASSKGAASSLFVTTGNADFGGGDPGDSTSIVKVDPTTMTKQDIWTVAVEPGTDDDFGGSPTLFQGFINGSATNLIGACNKNGRYYALDQNDLAAGPVWTDRLSFCISAGVWDPRSRSLFLSGSATKVHGQHVEGSIRKVNPSTGAVLWATGVAGSVLGSPSLDAGGVIAVPLYQNTSGFGVQLINEADGTILANLHMGKRAYAQPVFADGELFTASACCSLSAWAPSA